MGDQINDYQTEEILSEIIFHQKMHAIESVKNRNHN